MLRQRRTQADEVIHFTLQLAVIQSSCRMMVGAFVAIFLLAFLGYQIAVNRGDQLCLHHYCCYAQVNCLNYEESELRDKLVKYGLV